MLGSSLATITFAALASAATLPHSHLAKRYGDSYTYYTGNGASWPAISAWGTWDEIWASNLPLLEQSCGWNGWGADNSADEIADIQSAVEQVAGESGVDERFIFAIIMQESKGCVRVITTNNGVSNPGLMQSHDGTGTCAGVNPCPASEILQMVRDGTEGTASGAGLEQNLATTSAYLGGVTAQAYYAAARLYNSGSVDYTNLDNGFTSTACYASDVANRLQGWTLAASTCTA